MNNLLTEEDVKKMLQISDRQTRALFQIEGFPCFRVGKQYRVDEAEMMEYLKKNKDIKLDYTRT